MSKLTDTQRAGLTVSRPVNIPGGADVSDPYEVRRIVIFNCCAMLMFMAFIAFINLGDIAIYNWLLLAFEGLHPAYLISAGIVYITGVWLIGIYMIKKAFQLAVVIFKG